jgi:hypothetical protein
METPLPKAVTPTEVGMKKGKTVQPEANSREPNAIAALRKKPSRLRFGPEDGGSRYIPRS